jgi:hypothetical protein
MTPNSPQVVEQLAWEGLVSGPAALTIWLCLAAVAAISLWRERHVVGRGWAASFWVLRLAAFGFALWMLAGPTQQRIERTSTSQSIAIFADGSDSMDIVDPPEPTDAVRWTLAMDSGASDEALVCCDRLSVALGTARGNCLRFNQFVKEHRPTKQLAALVTTIAASVARAAAHADDLVAGLDNDAFLLDRATRIAALIEGPIEDSLTAIRKSLGMSDRVLADDFSVRLDQLTEAVGSAQRRTQVFAADLAQQLASNGTPEPEIDALSRREKASRALDALEDQLDGELTENLRIQRYRFDRAAGRGTFRRPAQRRRCRRPPRSRGTSLERACVCRADWEFCFAARRAVAPR